MIGVFTNYPDGDGLEALIVTSGSTGSSCQPVITACVEGDGTISNFDGILESVDGAYTIDESLGQLSGDNLFHSFARFGIDGKVTRPKQTKSILK